MATGTRAGRLPAMPTLSSLLAGFAAGVILLQTQPTLPPWPAAIAVLAALGAIAAPQLTKLLPRWLRARAGIGAAAALWYVLAGTGIGFGYAASRAALRLADELPMAWEGADIVVVGVVDDLPQVSERGVRFTLTVESVSTPEAIVPRRLGLAWYAQWQKGGPHDPVPGIAAGERWQLAVRLKRPHGTANPHGFDVESWLLENGIRATGYVRRDEANRRLAAFAGRAGDWVQRARAAVRDRIRAALPESGTAGVLVALTIGDQRSISPAQWEIFGRTGITHLMSISGLHVTVFAALAGSLAHALVRRSIALTRLLPARRVAVGVGVAAAFGYVLLAGAGVPAQRTLLMLLVAALGLWLSHPGTATVVWLWALAAVLAGDPWAPLAAGFWLSFGAVGLLLYGAGGRIGCAPAATMRAWCGRRLAVAAHAQWLMTAGMVPLTLALFQQVSLVAPVANALAIPLVTFAVVPLALAGIVLPVDWLWQVADAILGQLVAALAAVARSDAAVWQQHAPPPWSLPAALVAIAWLASPRGVPGRCLAPIWLLPLFVVVPARPGAGELRMTVLDVGQGLAVVVETRTRALLYDTGPRYTESADAGARIVAPFLRAAGVRRLDVVVVSHADSDHSGGLVSVLQAVPTALLLSSLPEDPSAPTPPGLHGRARRCVAGLRWHWDAVTFTLLHPAEAHYANPRIRSNDLSCVLRIDSAWGSVLLSGDIEAASERELVASDAAALRADVLVVPHHGSRTSSTPAFVAAVAPAVAVFTPGYRNRFGHPRPDVVARYAGSARYRTDLDGALAFSFAAGSNLRPLAERERQRRYWQDPPRNDAAPLD
jgi:competence protein ComEC